MSQIDYDPPLAYCPVCEGPGGYLGCLGRKEWFRCRNCGCEFCLDLDALDPEVRAILKGVS